MLSNRISSVYSCNTYVTRSAKRDLSAGYTKAPSPSTCHILNGIKLRIQELPPMSIMVKEQVYALKVCLCPGLSWGSGSDLVISVIKGKEN